MPSAYIEATRPRFFLHGHQHLSAMTRIGDTEVIGIFGEAVLELKI